MKNSKQCPAPKVAELTLEKELAQSAHAHADRLGKNQVQPIRGLKSPEKLQGPAEKDSYCTPSPRNKDATPTPHTNQAKNTPKRNYASVAASKPAQVPAHRARGSGTAQNSLEENGTPILVHQGTGQRTYATVASAKPMQNTSQSWTKVSYGSRKNRAAKSADAGFFSLVKMIVS